MTLFDILARCLRALVFGSAGAIAGLVAGSAAGVVAAFVLPWSRPRPAMG